MLNGLGGNGSAGEVLQSDGDGTFSWTANGGGGGSVQKWVSFNNGGGINSDSGVSSVSAQNNSRFTVNFDTAFPNTNYAFAGGGQKGNNFQDGIMVWSQSMSTNSCQISTSANNNGGIDANTITVIFVQ